MPFLLLMICPVSASYCKLNCPAGLCSFCIRTVLYCFIKNSMQKELACEGEHRWYMLGSPLPVALVWGLCQVWRNSNGLSCSSAVLASQPQADHSLIRL